MLPRLCAFGVLAAMAAPISALAETLTCDAIRGQGVMPYEFRLDLDRNAKMARFDPALYDAGNDELTGTITKDDGKRIEIRFEGFLLVNSKGQQTVLQNKLTYVLARDEATMVSVPGGYDNRFIVTYRCALG